MHELRCGQNSERWYAQAETDPFLGDLRP